MIRSERIMKRIIMFTSPEISRRFEINGCTDGRAGRKNVGRGLSKRKKGGGKKSAKRSSFLGKVTRHRTFRGAKRGKAEHEIPQEGQASLSDDISKFLLPPTSERLNFFPSFSSYTFFFTKKKRSTLQI